MNSWHTKVRVRQGQGDGPGDALTRAVPENGEGIAVRAIFFGKHCGN